MGTVKYRFTRWLLRRFPSSRRWLARLTDVVVRRVLGPQIVVPPPASTHDQAALEAGTDAFNEASEVYFAEYRNPDFILNKPYSEPSEFPRYLFNMGVLFHWLRLAPGDVVLDLGAGTCWVSHFLNRYGCNTISVDVSPTALELGRKLFASDPKTRWDRDPRFVVYDGHSFPLPDGTCDRIIIHDAFHHLPNQAEVLREMSRVLRDGGIVAMVEPGRRHSLTSDSQREMNETGVLENDIIVEDLEKLAKRCGFTRATVVPISLGASIEVEAGELEAFLKGKGFHSYWTHQAGHLLAGHYILLYKGDYRPTTRRPGQVAATIELLELGGGGPIRVRRGEAAKLSVRVANVGDTHWLSEAAGVPGCTRLGAHLSRRDGRSIENDWFRAVLQEEMAPGQSARLDIELPPLDEPGSYRVVFDMVAEGVVWFAQKGSPQTELLLEVGESA